MFTGYSIGLAFGNGSYFSNQPLQPNLHGIGLLFTIRLPPEKLPSDWRKSVNGAENPAGKKGSRATAQYF